MSPYAVPLSMVLSSCDGVAAAGEVAKDEKHFRKWGQISFHYLWKHTPFTYKL